MDVGTVDERLNGGMSSGMDREDEDRGEATSKPTDA